MDRYELPEGWAWTTLKKIVEISYGRGLTSANRRGGTVAVYGSNGVVGSHDRALTRGVALVVGRKGSVGAVHLAPEPCWPIDTTYYIDQFPTGISPKYIFYFLRTLNLAELDRSTAVPGINREDLYDLSIPLPPLAEQQRIVARLDALLAQARHSRVALDRLPPLLKRARQAILAAAFRGDLTERDPAAEPADALLARLRAERRARWEADLRARGKDPAKHAYPEPAAPDTADLPDLPEGWAWTTLKKIVEISYGRGLTSANRRGGTVAVYGSNGVVGSHDRALTRGVALVVGRKGSVGAVHLAPEPCWPIDTTYYIDQFPTGISPKYIFYFLRTLNLAELDRSTAVPGINREDLYDLSIPLPPLAEQQRIVARLDALLSQTDAIEAAARLARRRLDLAEQALLTRAFRGELVPQDPSDEPASALLARLREAREAKGDERKTDSRAPRGQGRATLKKRGQPAGAAAQGQLKL